MGRLDQTDGRYKEQRPWEKLKLLNSVLYKIHQTQNTTIQRGTKNDVTVFFYGGVGGKGGWVLVWGVQICQQAYLVLFNVILHQGLQSSRNRGLPKVYISVLFVCIFFFIQRY